MEKPKVVLFGFSGQVEKDVRKITDQMDTCSGRLVELQLRARDQPNSRGYPEEFFT